MKEAIIQYNDDPNADGNHMLIGWKELVRCKDCKYGTEKSGNIICHNPTHDEYETDIRPFDWFCADGEKDS